MHSCIYASRDTGCEMAGRKNNFFEEHIEKLILVVVGIVCLWLLLARVLFSPNYIEYDNNKFGPGDIDNYISQQAQQLEDKLDSRPQPISPYEQRADDFLALVDSAIGNIDTSIYLPIPNPILKAIGIQPKYNMPRVGEVDEVVSGHIRAVAYVPTGQINEDSPYDSADCEPNDIDFVTVEGQFDVAGLYERFEDSFAGEQVRQEWRDPCLAKVVFAAVQLQRQDLLGEAGGDEMRSDAFADEIWSDWQNVPRTKIDHRKSMFEIIEKVEDLPPGGIEVRALQFDDVGVRMDLLQPQAYQIASAKEEWFPPSLHKEYADHQRETELEQRREAREAERQEREQELEQTRSARRRTTQRPEAQGERNLMMEVLGGISTSTTGRSDRLRRQTERRERTPREKPERLLRSKEDSKTVEDFYDELDQILIEKKTNLADSSEPLLLWAHDDTVEAGKCYRYRIRLGLLNPVAGKDQFSEADKSLKDDVILWSKFSDVTEPVEIPKILYFFPREIQEAARTVTIRICRYVLGYWYGKDFPVKVGEVIGKAVEYEAEDEDETAQAQGDVTVPETIDYSTGAVFVDIVPVSDWEGGNNLRARHYFDMLYSFDAVNINHMPIKPRYWTDELQAKFNEIKKLEGELKEPLRPWAEGVRRRRAPRGRIEGAPEITTEQEYIEMILQEAGQSERGRGRR